ncbi:DUF4400 domain-containing protein [Neiella sp. HB171785]|uniref:DUF4400 domain-containing protein n=1 Tax=Neiella litorisoli TaxID=2771431 RepID=A0A8J6QGG1_9GAMM|nr:DUF4400 domain-containing protein [Neiella litorisoli]MBD1389484.1 DUF4400 domain-containing protein [Neiella litorisoli]
MAETDVSNEPGQHVTLVHTLMLVGCCAILGWLFFFCKPAKVQHYVESEVSYLGHVVPSSNWHKITYRAGEWYQFLMVDSGVKNAIERTLIPDESSDSLSHATSKYSGIVYNVAHNSQILFYQVCFRASVLLYWLLLMAPLIIGFMVDGYYQWHIKRYTFGHVSTNRYQIWSRIWVALALLATLYVILPAVTVKLATLYAPALLIGMGLVIGQLWSNFQKSF